VDYEELVCYSQLLILLLVAAIYLWTRRRRLASAIEALWIASGFLLLLNGLLLWGSWPLQLLVVLLGIVVLALAFRELQPSAPVSHGSEHCPECDTLLVGGGDRLTCPNCGTMVVRGHGKLSRR